MHYLFKNIAGILVALSGAVVFSSCTSSHLPQMPEQYSDVLPGYAVPLNHKTTADRLPCPDNKLNVLLISGGGSNGAFTAGVINGWADNKTMPKFNLVAGVSTGALQATAAFIGPEEGKKIVKNAYTTITKEDVVSEYWLPLFHNSISSAEPLKQQLEKYVTDEVIDKVAHEYRRGRRLYVATTDLANRRVVVWDLSKLAAAEVAERYDLYRKVLLAAAAVPGFYPPVSFDVTIDGRSYCQYHTDLTTKSLFLAPWMLKQFAADKVDVYAIVNHQLFLSEPREVSDNIPGMIMAMVKDALKARAYFGLKETKDIALKCKARYCYIVIPPELELEHNELDFDPEDMQKLYDSGYKSVGAPDSWRSEIPLW